jgi:hypothetical protein
MDPNFHILITKDIIVGSNFLSHYVIMLYLVHLAGVEFELARLVVTGPDCIDSYKQSNEIMLLLVLYLYLE